MNNKLLLVTSITLLYRESQLLGGVESSAPIVRQIVSAIKLPEISLGVDHEREILDGLKSTALSMCDAPAGHQYALSELLQRLKLNTLNDEGLYDIIQEGMVAELDEKELRKTCLNLQRTLRNHFRDEKVQQIINKAMYTLKFDKGQITDMTRFVADVCSQLEPYQVNTNIVDPAVIGEIDTSNTAALQEIFAKVKDDASGLGIMQTGYQGINRMLNGGIRRGEEIVLGALQHNYKTGFSLSIFKQIALYNVPYMKDPTKKPLLLRISFEDSLVLNFRFLYKSLKENETGVEADLEGVSVEEMAAYVQEKLKVNGYHTRFLHVNPSEWTYKDICNKVLELEAEGYEIHLCMVDYLLKVPTTGCTIGPAGYDLRNMYERIRDFMTSRDIAFVTPHQLSPDAKMLARDGRQDLVKDLVGGGYYSGSKQIDQVVDVEIFFHIVIFNGKSYLTVQRGKHRGQDLTPREHQFCVLQFHEIGGIPDDLGKADTTRKKVGGGPIGSGEETPFWMAGE